jgi:hypothetical protein
LGISRRSKSGEVYSVFSQQTSSAFGAVVGKSRYLKGSGFVAVKSKSWQSLGGDTASGPVSV